MAQRNPSVDGYLWPSVLGLGAVGLAISAGAPALSAWHIGTWHLTRAAGLVAFGFLWLSVVLGLLQSTGYVKAPAVINLHTSSSVWALYATTFHAAILIYDRHTPFSLAGVVVPFTSEYRPLLVGIGGLAFYIALGVTVTTYLRGRVGPRAWRLIHWTSLAGFLFAVVHSVALGTDSNLPWVAFGYRFAAISVAALLGYRVYVGVKKRAGIAGGR